LKTVNLIKTFQEQLTFNPNYAISKNFACC